VVGEGGRVESLLNFMRRRRLPPEGRSELTLPVLAPPHITWCG